MSKVQPEQVKDLSTKLLKGSISHEELKILEDWFRAAPDHKREWDLGEETRDQLKARLYENISQTIASEVKVFPLWRKVAIAASILLLPLLGGIALWNTLTKKSDEVLVVSGTAGQVRKLMLPDHSLVWLKGNSSLDYPANFSDSTRNVTLHGEALFEVSKDRRHPFIINTGNYVTRVLGTSFNIKSNNEGAFKLTVLTGKVQVRSTINTTMQKPVLVTPGKEFEMLNVAALPRVAVSSLDHKDAVVSGTQYPMNFDETGFDEIKRRVEEKFDITINTDAASYQQCRVSANVTDQSLDNTLKVICAAIGAEYKVNKNIITITGGGCN